MTKKTYERISRKRFDEVKRLHISYRSARDFDTLEVFLSKRKDASKVRLKGLFEMLGIPEAEAEKILDNSRFKPVIYDGGYHEGGKQRLADLVGKEIEFHRGYGYALCCADKHGTHIFKPRSK